jgi:ABC-type branched-subunit amino acid transport system permease subunit
MAAGTVLSILVLACLALLLGAYALRRRGGQRRQIVLMLVLAVVIAANVAIWVMPGSGGKALVEAEPS